MTRLRTRWPLRALCTGHRPRSVVRLCLLAAALLLRWSTRAKPDGALGFAYAPAYPKTRMFSGRLQPRAAVIARRGENQAQAVPAKSSAEKNVVSEGLAGFVRKWATVGGVGLVGVTALLYITSGVEHLSHRMTSVLTSSSPVVAGCAGLAVGTLHTFAGPDHLAGLTPLVIGQRKSPLAAFGLGALWGSGHATGQVLIGLACLLVRFGLLKLEWAPAFGQVSSVLVGTSLILIGLLGFNEVRQWDSSEEEDLVSTRKNARFGWATYATGVLHGLSLDAIIFITPALALPRLAGSFHVLGVVLGTLVSMGGYTALLSRLVSRSPNLIKVSACAASIAVALGLIILAASLGISFDLPGLPSD